MSEEQWMDEVQQEYYKELARQDDKNRWYSILVILRHPMAYHDNYYFKWWQKVFYVFKTIVCIILNRRRSLWADSNAVDSMACWDFAGWTSPDIIGEACDWTELAVGYGYFKDWHFDIYRNSSA